MTNNNTRPRRTSVPKSKRKKQRSIGGGGRRVSRTPDTHSIASSSSSTWSSDKAAAAKQRNAVKNELNDIIDNDQDGFWTRPSNAEERQRIREFWLQLREDERRSLIKIEKEAVLKKMKEQQRHSCNCSVCGKKRTAIEDELEVLYDAYYEELEQYTNNNQNSSGINPLTGTPVSDMDDDDDDDDDDDEEEDPDYESDYDDDDDDDDIENDPSDDDEDDDEDEYSSDHLAFGNSLTVKGGILTVADDLLQNNGKKFLDMMERLAERRIKKEDPLDYRQEDDEEDEEDDEYLDDDDYEDEEEDARTELQRIEEGRRTFQIFAARMFEQRVLAAYREKVAQERQQRLIQELEEEDRLRQEKELKKQKEKERKKDKKMQLKKQKEEERRAKEAAKKAEEERLRAEKQKKLEEERQRREQERRQKEEARLRREEEKRRRLQEERERAAEKERKRQEREMKRKQERKEQEDRDRQEQQFKQEKERRERELKEEMERRDRALQERKLKWEKEEQRRKSQQTLIDALMGPSSSSSLSSSLSSSSSSITTASDTASSPKTKTNRSIAPIGPPSSNQLHRPPPTVVCNDPSNDQRPATENSFFSNFLFGPSKDKNQDKTTQERSDIQTSNDTPKANWTNGWTASTFLSEDFHGRLFGNVLPDRNTVLLEKAKAAYNKLDEISRTATFLGPVPPFYTLAQIHRMMIDLYCDCSATIQDLYQAMVMNPSSPFRCTSDLQHGVLVHYQEPGRFGFPNPLSPLSPSTPAVPGSYSPFQPPAMGNPLPLFKGMT